MARFDYDVFYGDDNCIGFNAKKYSKEQALEIGANELETDIENVRVSITLIVTATLRTLVQNMKVTRRKLMMIEDVIKEKEAVLW